MSRPIVLGNGNILAALDHKGRLSDFYFPFVGFENHVAADLPHKIGVWIEGQMSWVDGEDWQVSLSYKNDALVSEVKALNQRIGVELNFLDSVYNEKNIFIRKILVKNIGYKKREIRIFLNQHFQIYGIGKGDTAYYDPYCRSIIHYKSKRNFLINGLIKNRSFDDYSVGLARIEGKDGTWRDAEDGVLSKNPIEYGSVDSTIGFIETVEIGAEFEIDYWIAVAETFEEVKKLNNYVLEKTTGYLLETTHDFWNAWVNKTNIDFFDLDKKIIDVFKKSLLIMRTHIDNRGGVIASGDSDLLQYGRDTYSYVWHRDAAFIVMAFDKAGFFNITRKFFEFSNEVVSEEGYFLHKYLPDKSRGSSWHPWVKDNEIQLPIQEDETALVLYALWNHYEASKDLDFIENVYNSLIKKTADFLDGYRDGRSRLPLGSYDLWEQKFGISTFSSATVFGALDSARKFAEILGKEKDAKKYSTASKEVKKAIIQNLYNEKDKSFYKLIEFEGGEIFYDRTIDTSSFYGIYNFDILKIDDFRVKNFAEIIKEKLECKTKIGGVARYEGDDYYRKEQNKELIPGNPWFVTTLWLARYYLRLAKKEEDLEEFRKWLTWTADKALESGVLSEQINPLSGGQLSVGPLIWSHAEFIVSVHEYLEKLKELRKIRNK